jgi:hypothetical protein
MEKTYSKQIVFAFILLLSSIYTNTAIATSTSTTTQGTQLAYFYGYHYYPSYWGGPVYHRGAYWTPWRYIGHGCRKSCLISKWNGRVIRCTKRCY